MIEFKKVYKGIVTSVRQSNFDNCVIEDEEGNRMWEVLFSGKRLFYKGKERPGVNNYDKVRFYGEFEDKKFIIKEFL